MRAGGIEYAVTLVALAVAACGSDEIAPPASLTRDDANEECGQESVPEDVFLKQGFLADAEWWKCPKPRPGSGGAEITEVEGSLGGVTGSMVRILLYWEVDTSLASGGTDSLEGMNVVFWYGASRRDGYYLIPVESDQNPLPVDLYLNFEANGGQYPLNFALDDGSGTPQDPAIGDIKTVDFELIEVGSGDIQINLNWDTVADLDLHVTDPSGFEIFFGAMNSPSGGELDLDSYAACPYYGERGRGNENVFWPIGEAPSGEYLIEVNLFRDCETFAAQFDTHYRVTLILDRSDVWMYEGVFSREEPEMGYEKVEITRFTYPYSQ